LEDALGWPEGTLAVLRQAFQLGLGRATGWELPPTTAVEGAWTAAASVYRRGVALRAAGARGATQKQEFTGKPSSQRDSPTNTGLYPIHVGNAATPATSLSPAGQLVVADARVAALWPTLVPPAGASCLHLALDEHGKTLASVAQILAGWHSASRPARWLIIGGGLLSDVAAFAGALAGARLELVPTTLLAMADASVGGKTGVNFAPYGKNQLGAFYFPDAVHVWTGWLATLPPRELAAGGAECLKHAMLTGDVSLAKAVAAALAARDLSGLAQLLPAVIRVKADVVAEDPGESARRATLNLGHTLAHALEAVSQERTQGEETLLHGEAVAVGLVFALILSRRLAGLAQTTETELRSLLTQAGIVPDHATLARRLGVQTLAGHELASELLRWTGYDKKNIAGSQAPSQWVLLAAPGIVKRGPAGAWTVGVPPAAILDAWSELTQTL